MYCLQPIDSSIFMLTFTPAGGAVAGSDYQTITGRRIRWRPNKVDPQRDTANDAPFTITIIDDNVNEDDEYLEVHFVVETTGYAFPSAIARVTILDDDRGKKVSTSFR